MRAIIKEFLDSDLTESEFFNLPKEDLMSLKDYLEVCQKQAVKFRGLIEKPFSSIQDKCDWIQRIGFGSLQNDDAVYLMSWLNLFAADGIDLSVSLENGEYKDLAQIPTNKESRILLDRQEDLYFIQDELHEIDEVGRDVFSGFSLTKRSISKSFTADYISGLGLDLFTCNDEYGLDFILRSYERHGNYYDKEIITNQAEKEKVLNRVQIKK